MTCRALSLLSTLLLLPACIEGPPGPTGGQGETGPEGPEGEAGPEGPAGMIDPASCTVEEFTNPANPDVVIAQCPQDTFSLQAHCATGPNAALAQVVVKPNGDTLADGIFFECIADDPNEEATLWLVCCPLPSSR